MSFNIIRYTKGKYRSNPFHLEFLPPPTLITVVDPLWTDMGERFKNYIAGRWTSATSQKHFRNIDPADMSTCLGEFPQSESEDIDLAVRAARSALTDWRRTPAPRRGQLVAAWGKLIQQNQENLAQIITRESGKIFRESMGEVRETVEMASFIAAQGRLLEGQTFPSESPHKLCMTLRQPVGVCALITPWNFPLLIPCWKLFPAILCGNTVIFKPAEDTPLSAHRFVELAAEAGIPAGVINLLHGTGEQTGRGLVRHPGVDLVSFTGSSETGREISQTCARSLTRCSLEMGGKNAQIILKDADLGQAVEGAVQGAFSTSGQRCTATSRLIVEEKIASEFAGRLVERIKSIRIGNGFEEKSDLGPVINEGQRKKIHGYVDIGRGEGAQLLSGGAYYREGDCARGFFYEPTLFDGVQNSMRIAQEEIFGPVTGLIRASGLEEAVSILNDTPYGLSSSVYTRDIETAMRALQEIETGVIYINGPTVGAEVHMPFGGLKNTGNGHREAGRNGLDIFTEWKSIYINFDKSACS